MAKNISIQKRLKPFLIKATNDAVRGYVFGSVFGMFVPGNRSLSESMHASGKTFAKMSLVFTATEFACEIVRNKKDAYNTVISGTVAGAMTCKKHPFLSAAVFGAYSGISEYLKEY
ncbi:hypothetical protein ECANGB1_1444 [Enterospora canceri]|uniref:Mitochondrial import inner membrane translocase subunit TIM22 n=1 Tax=Enterospora canceri TaxID=1081671 RepID=A0A1Y1S790_9MICR|nr:hypothetical protein ECANGB1_1444 [Enterospora canceri]